SPTLVPPRPARRGSAVCAGPVDPTGSSSQWNTEASGRPTQTQGLVSSRTHRRSAHSATAPVMQTLTGDTVSGHTTLQDDARHAARDMLRPDGKQLTTLMAGIITEAATAMTYTRSKLRERASSGKGLSGRTLVEWHKAEGIAMARAKAIAAMTDQS